ncbi:chromosome segregation protein [Kibdelosporangium persicum]|uniref:DivIVA domain-containing protein n=1 Tax=Kibdelosporangium persicum TaxID=2698649 RepID=A0ABX2FAU6_9PSEU|nr:chromosome segregation protein [Kibdelosporangium persicum]NRN68407.1 DivIVA domain-containing protein [Kibdelosporangium persicum]
MALGEERELVPLGAGFDYAKRGYNRAQVDEHLERVDRDMRLLAADRDAAVSQAADLARQLEIARSELDDMRGQIERLSLPPTTLEGLSERLQRMLRLAQDEATETKARAEAEAGHIRAKAETDANALRARYEEMLRGLDTRRAEMEAEHREVLAKARAEAGDITKKAEEERARLDAESAQRRSQVEEDFEIAMASRRTESMRALAEQEATSKAEAERRVREATEEANRRRHDAITEAKARLQEASEEAHRRVREATEEANRRISHAAQRVAALRQLRTRVANQLRQARSLIQDADVVLENATPVLDPLPEERPADESPTKGLKSVTQTEAAGGPPKEHWEPAEPDENGQSDATKPVVQPVHKPRP